MSHDVLAAADHAMRHWLGAEPGRIRLGSDAHKRLFCRMLLDTHNPYKPAVIEWPALSEDALHRITSLPIWDIAVQTEGKAKLRVATYTAMVNDPLLHEALTMDGDEEARHKVVLSKMVEAYGIALAPEPTYEIPSDPEWGWLVTGYSECIDSFFAFGLFESAKRTGYFPADLVDTFEPVMQEEARHILFFANWVAWHRRQLSLWRRITFECKVMRAWLFLIWERIGIAKGLDNNGEMQDANFTLTGHEQIGIELKPGELLDLCLAQDSYRMDGYDPRLLRPTFVPRMARLIRRFLR
ncbi:ferritin-like domain-containing protein [Dyella solisilvae]|uniref:Ferritin-like domain-containing protein n=1 Tax=Dyella solisilvae TaxID=1920168 RepID=A0A370K403_9GAMM|nr:ferritin-like domain-containing protein [Dyella solisilvae]RDI97338.1 ferritin-like domain-containing protein [Dyella solisilvae]